VRLHSGTAQKTLAELGISKRQSHDWQKLADIPAEEFEAGLAEATKPTTREGLPIAQNALSLTGVALLPRSHSIYILKSRGIGINHGGGGAAAVPLRLAASLGCRLPNQQND
jgi:hypothetical protein